MSAQSMPGHVHEPRENRVVEKRCDCHQGALVRDFYSLLSGIFLGWLQNGDLLDHAVDAVS